jgi:hypothetical protein
MEISLIIISLALLALVVRAAAAGHFFRGRRAPLAMLTAFHDWSPRDRQAAMEQIIELNAGKEQEVQESGEGEKERSREQ